MRSAPSRRCDHQVRPTIRTWHLLPIRTSRTPPDPRQRGGTAFAHRPRNGERNSHAYRRNGTITAQIHASPADLDTNWAGAQVLTPTCSHHFSVIGYSLPRADKIATDHRLNHSPKSELSAKIFIQTISTQSTAPTTSIRSATWPSKVHKWQTRRRTTDRHHNKPTTPATAMPYKELRPALGVAADNGTTFPAYPMLDR